MNKLLSKNLQNINKETLESMLYVSTSEVENCLKIYVSDTNR